VITNVPALPRAPSRVIEDTVVSFLARAGIAVDGSAATASACTTAASAPAP
jgi:hypothetical protein